LSRQPCIQGLEWTVTSGLFKSRQVIICLTKTETDRGFKVLSVGAIPFSLVKTKTPRKSYALSFASSKALTASASIFFLPTGMIIILRLILFKSLRFSKKESGSTYCGFEQGKLARLCRCLYYTFAFETIFHHTPSFTLYNNDWLVTFFFFDFVDQNENFLTTVLRRK
jgi:hypothetical protein